MEKIIQKTKKCIEKFDLIRKKDRVLVACSGGKDSTVALYALDRLGYDVEAITVDAKIGNYTEENIKNLRKFCKKYKIKLNVVSFRKEFGYSLCYIKSILDSKDFSLTSCAICGVLRRHLLNKYARKLKADKLVTGHNLNDEAQGVVMNLLKNNLELLARQGPKTGVEKDDKFVQRVKPLFFVSEGEIESFSKKMNFPVNYRPCPCRKGVYRCLISKELSNYGRDVHENIIKWLLNILPELKENFKSEKEQSYCEKCGEPCKGKKCRACEILENIK